MCKSPPTWHSDLYGILPHPQRAADPDAARSSRVVPAACVTREEGAGG